MKILHLSDTHACHRGPRDLPEADVMVHSGDFCMVGNSREQESIKEMTIRLERRKNADGTPCLFTTLRPLDS